MLCGLFGSDCMADDRDKVSDQYPITAVTQHDLQAATTRYASLSSGENSVRETDGQLEENADPDRKSTRLNSSHIQKSRMPSSA